MSLEHMQVHYTTVGRTGLSKFRRNVISFPQDVAGFAKRMRLLENYRVGDRLNSSRGPGEDPKRPMRCAHEATEEEKRYAVDEHGYVVFRATVVEVRETKSFLRCYGAGDEELTGWEEMQ